MNVDTDVRPWRAAGYPYSAQKNSRKTKPGDEIEKKKCTDEDVEEPEEELEKTTAPKEEAPEAEKSYAQKKLERDERLVQGLIRMTEQMLKTSKANAAETKKEQLAHKKSIVDNMLKTVRALNQTNYTRESYRKCMASVEKAMAAYRGGELTQAKLNRALTHIRAGMTKLQPARRADERGKTRDAEKAFSQKRSKQNHSKVKAFLKEQGIYVDGMTDGVAISVSAGGSAPVEAPVDLQA